MVTSLETNQEFSLVKKLINGIPQEELEALLKDFKKRLSQKFRSQEERGFDTAWLQTLQLFLQD